MTLVRFINEWSDGFPGISSVGQYYNIRMQMLDWLARNIGTESKDTWYKAGIDSFRFQGVFFAREEDAVAFKLRFGL